MNAFIYCVNSCSEVSSRDCLVASDKHFCLLFGSWFRTPPPPLPESRRKKILEKIPFQVGMGLYKGQKQGRDEKIQELHLLWNDGGLLSGLQVRMRERKKTTLYLLPIFADVQ